MKFIISGREYDLDSLGTMSLFDTLEMKKQTGMSVRDFQERGEALMKVAKAAEDDGIELELDEDMLILLAVMIWLVRRKAGEHLTLEQATDFPFGDLQVIADEEEEPPDPPLAGSAGGRDGEAPARKSRKTSKRTSVHA